MKSLCVKHKTKKRHLPYNNSKNSQTIAVNCLKMSCSLNKALWMLCIFILYFFFLSFV